MVPGLTSSNASLAAENTRLNARMAELVKDLTEENTHLLNENQRLNETMRKVSFCLEDCLLSGCKGLLAGRSVSGHRHMCAGCA